MFDANRRQYPRINYPCQLTLWIPSGNTEIVLANTTNIGMGGVCVHLDHSVDVGTKIDIQLSFPNTSTPFKCQGKVVRCLKESDKFFNTGIQFDPLEELKSAFLSGQVSELMDMEKKENP